MKEKLGAIAACLLFAVCFGGVGVFASWVIGGSILDWQRAKEWVRVKADVVSYSGGEVVYRYAIDGREHHGTRLNPSVIGPGGADNVDDEIDGRLSAALSEKKPITVFVDPANPAQSMADREMPWKMTLFFIPFALAFGGVGVGALYMLVRVVSGAEKRSRKGARTSDAMAGVLGLWVFAFFWNVVSFPIALLALPQMWAEREWWGLLILLFPLIGVLLLWGAIAGSWNLLRRGGARLTLSTDNPRAGSPLQGFVAFPRGVRAGESFRVRLVCNRLTSDGDGGTNTDVHWFREQTPRTSESGQGVRLPFRFEVPSEVPCTREASTKDKRTFQWRIEATSTDLKGATPYGFEFHMQPAPADAMVGALAKAPEADPAEPQLAALGPELARLKGIIDGRGMDATQLARLSSLTPEQRAQVEKLMKWAPKAKKIVIWVIVGFVALQIIGAIVAVVASMSSN